MKKHMGLLAWSIDLLEHISVRTDQQKDALRQDRERAENYLRRTDGLLGRGTSDPGD